jgi:light-regulated signal transduction histidine kinase (bacteriophytochrome)
MVSSPHGATIKVNTLHPASADRLLIHQVWINLISNAVKYSSKKEKPELEIDSAKSGDVITYHIKDNGVGFKMENMLINFLVCSKGFIVLKNLKAQV